MIRRADLTDVTALVPLYDAFFREDHIDMDRRRLTANLSAMLQDPRAAIFVAEVDAALVGLASVSTTQGVEFGCAAEFEDLYVAPSHRRKGVSRKLVNAILDWADSRNAEVVALVITAEAEHEQGLSMFYEKLGFSRSNRLTMYRTSTR